MNYYMKRVEYTDYCEIGVELNAFTETLNIITEHLEAELEGIKTACEKMGQYNMTANFEQQYIPVLHMLQRNMHALKEEIEALESRKY